MALVLINRVISLLTVEYVIIAPADSVHWCSRGPDLKQSCKGVLSRVQQHILETIRVATRLYFQWTILQVVDQLYLFHWLPTCVLLKIMSGYATFY